jgi:purine-binding chemotaxis protein CheW
MENHLVVFVLANEQYAVGIAAVSEIIKLQPITHVPRAPAFVEGVTNLRGKVLPVLDLRKRFGLAAAAASKESRIVVAEINNVLVGMVVDAVTEVLRVPEGAIEPPSPVVTTVDSAFISGIAKVGSRLIILLDLEKVLLPGEKADLREAFAPGAPLAASVAAVVVPPPPAGQVIPPAPEQPESQPAEPPAAPPVEEGPASARETPPQVETGPASQPTPAQPKKRRRRKKANQSVEAAPPAEAVPGTD